MGALRCAGPEGQLSSNSKLTAIEPARKSCHTCRRRLRDVFAQHTAYRASRALSGASCGAGSAAMVRRAHGRPQCAPRALGAVALACTSSPAGPTPWALQTGEEAASSATVLASPPHPPSCAYHARPATSLALCIEPPTLAPQSARLSRGRPPHRTSLAHATGQRI